MAKPFSSNEANRIIEQHRALAQRLDAAVAKADAYAPAVKKASDALAAQELRKVLEDIPIEEINRDKRGFRVKALRDSGYQTIADLAAASLFSIASVNGVSEEGAYAIRRIVDDIIARARPGVKIRLSLDNRTEAAAQLIAAIHRFRRSRAPADTCRMMITASRQNIANAIGDLSAVNGGMKRIFASRAKKEKAAEAFSYLSGLRNGAYWQRAEESLTLLDSAGMAADENDGDSTVKISTAAGVVGEKPQFFFLERYMASFTDEMKQFIEAITKDTEVPVGIHAGLMSVVLAKAAKKSLDEHRPVAVSEILNG